MVAPPRRVVSLQSRPINDLVPVFKAIVGDAVSVGDDTTRTKPVPDLDLVITRPGFINLQDDGLPLPFQG